MLNQQRGLLIGPFEPLYGLFAKSDHLEGSLPFLVQIEAPRVSLEKDLTEVCTSRNDLLESI